jgi:hypothetical protein
MLKFKKYDVENLLGELQDDEQVLDRVLDVAGDVEIREAITETADSSVSIWNNVLFEAVPILYNSGNYDDVIQEYGDAGDLIKNIGQAWYYYTERQIYNNFDEIVFNYAVRIIQDRYPEFVDKIKVSDLALALTNIDDGNKFADIESIVDELVEWIKGGDQ